MVISAIVAVTLTLPLVGWGADEPFFGDFKLSDALVMLVGGGIGTAFWCVWSITTVFAVSQRWWNPAVLIVQ